MIKKLRNYFRQHLSAPLHRYLSHRSLQKHYDMLAGNVRNKARSGGAVRVCFLATEASKWSYHYLYKAMQSDPFFEPFILFAPRYRPFFLTSEAINEEYSFFTSRYSGAKCIYDRATQKFEDLKVYKPDIVFYTQPWDLPPLYKVDQVSRFALTCYSPYPLAESPETLIVNLNTFHYLLYRHFVTMKLQLKQYRDELSYTDRNLVVTGHPKLDAYLDSDIIGKTDEKPCVIYAPHSSIPRKSWCKQSTFEWTGRLMLEYAKQHPEMNWVFKPHPDVYRVMIANRIMTEQEMKDYFAEWARLGTVYTTGDYFRIFRRSRCLVTDCISFLGEYLPTGKPVIHLRSKDGVNFSAINRQVISHYYQVWNTDDLASTLKLVLEDGQDPMRDARCACMRRLGLGTESASMHIIDHLKKTLS